MAYEYRRTFRRKLTLYHVLLLLLDAIVIIYGFWQCDLTGALLGFSWLLLGWYWIDRIIYTRYILYRDRLEVKKGHTGNTFTIYLDEIETLERRKANLWRASYVLIRYRVSRYITVQPKEENKFVNELQRLKLRVSRG